LKKIPSSNLLPWRKDTADIIVLPSGWSSIIEIKPLPVPITNSPLFALSTLPGNPEPSRAFALIILILSLFK
jgi:hypothetical protein